MPRNYSLFQNTRPASAPAPRPAPAAASTVGDVQGVVALLERAKASGLRFPKLWLQLPDGGDLRITVAGDKSSTPGFLMLTDGRPFGQNKYFGRISPAGELQVGRDGFGVREALAELLSQLAEHPAETAAAYGRLTGHCSFCGLKLTDERSVGVGYGPTCAEKFGMPWGARS